MNTAIYVRVSTKDQNLGMQLDEIKRLIKARGWIGNVTTFKDPGFSGVDSTRPEYNRMLKLCREGKFKRVVVWKLDRLGRSLVDLVNVMNEFNERGIDLVSLQDSVDTSTTHGRLMVNIVSVFAEYERELIRERTLAGVARKKKQLEKEGKTWGRQPDIKRHIEILKLSNSGHTYRQIAEITGASKALISKVLSSKNRRDSA